MRHLKNALIISIADAIIVQTRNEFVDEEMKKVFVFNSAPMQLKVKKRSIDRLIRSNARTHVKHTHTPCTYDRSCYCRRIHISMSFITLLLPQVCAQFSFFFFASAAFDRSLGVLNEIDQIVAWTLISSSLVQALAFARSIFYVASDRWLFHRSMIAIGDRSLTRSFIDKWQMQSTIKSNNEFRTIDDDTMTLVLVIDVSTESGALCCCSWSSHDVDVIIIVWRFRRKNLIHTRNE